VDQNSVTREIQFYFSSRPEFIFVVLFGSFATNKQKTDSDVDIAVLKTNNIPLLANEKEELISTFFRTFKRPVDIIDLSQTHVPLLQEILTKGKIIISRTPAVREKIVHRMIYEVADFLPLRRKEQLARLRRFVDSE
jgi:predicted nucleotidyltransferase